eukprot:symbB.v1.2.037135.t1/scaffold5400.1/size27565/3
MAVRSRRIACAYRDFCRAVQNTFAADRFAQQQLRLETARTLRQQASRMSEDALVADLKSGTDMIRYEIVQASLNPETQNYRAHINQEHLSKGSVLDLLPPDEALKRIAASKRISCASNLAIPISNLASGTLTRNNCSPCRCAMALPEINRGREKADKAQFLREVYDVTFTGGDARQNLWKKVIPDAKKEKVEKVNDVKAQEWLREERRRAGKLG